MPIETLHCESTVSGIPARDVRVYTPPGYDAARSGGYPVLYMHDGQNVFAPGGAYGCWNAEQIAAEEDGAGRIPPLVIAAIDNDGDNRRHEYVPPGDRYKQWQSGCADRYLQFVTENVMPRVSAAFNVTRERAETGIAGSSLGGVVSLYIGLQTRAFGLIGSMSTAICWARRFLDAIPEHDTNGCRIYHDVGTAEFTDMAPDDYDHATRTLHANLQQTGLNEPNALTFVTEEGGHHNEADWCRRLPDMLRWLFGDLTRTRQDSL